MVEQGYPDLVQIFFSLLFDQLRNDAFESVPPLIIQDLFSIQSKFNTSSHTLNAWPQHFVKYSANG